MRLLRIQLHNFGAFADVDIPLDEVRAAVVMGMNGTGKSTAFIDAVTWVLFGECRISTDEMMRLGTDEMFGVVDFALSGEIYRVVRSRSVRTKAGKSSLELQVMMGSAMDPADMIAPAPKWMPASGARLPETQEKICGLLNMDYQLLTATGFLVQNEADRFTRATAGERKVNLSKILRLDLYPQWRSLALQRGHRAMAELEGRRDLLTAAEDRAKMLGPLRGEHAGVEIILQSNRAALQRIGEIVPGRQRELAELEAQQAAAAGLAEKIEALKKKQRDLAERHRSLIERRVRAQKILANKDTIAAKVTEETDAKARLLLLDMEVEKLTKDNEAWGVELTEIREHLSARLKIERNLEAINNELDRELRAFTNEGNMLAHDLKQHEKAVELLGQVPCGADLQARCRFTQEAVKSQAAIPALRDALATRTFVMPEQSSTSTLLAQQLLDWKREGWAEWVSAVEERMKQTASAMADAVARRLKSRDVLKKLEEYTRLVPELEAATRELEQLDRDLVTTVFDSEANEQEAEGLLRDKLAADLLTGRIAELRLVVSNLEVQRRDSQAVIDGLVGQLAQLGERIRLAEEAEQSAVTIRTSVERDLVMLRRWQALAVAYERIPVLILESAIPLFEQETNRILQRTSKAGMSVRFDTQKALKSREGLAETLDIIVRDVHGERRYEAYSGGEKFRLNLSIRIGLSKLLCNRAGAKLETLVVDEGLGSLDREALEMTRDCIEDLQDEFPLVLVITHVEAMQHTFPSQIVVRDERGGSTVEVLP